VKERDFTWFSTVSRSAAKLPQKVIGFTFFKITQLYQNISANHLSVYFCA